LTKEGKNNNVKETRDYQAEPMWFAEKKLGAIFTILVF
jgi:hypothetical protein